MNILGINSGRAAPIRVDPENRRPLSDGGAALIREGRIACATIEERYTRKRFSPGFRMSGLACLKQAGLNLEQIDAVGHSTCCDVFWTKEQDIIDSLVDAWRDVLDPDRIASHFRGRVFTIDHHESHAMLAFVGSGMDRSLVCVMDGIGNRYGDPDTFNTGSDWWRGAFQRQDYYVCEWVGNRVKIQKVHEDACDVNGIGLGELYRSVTHYLGWNSYQYAGKTMALASFGNPVNLADVKLIDFRPPHSIQVNVPDIHPDPIRQIDDVLHTSSCKIPQNLRRPADPAQNFLCDVAALLQSQLEKALAKAVGALADKHHVDNIAFGGGVAMNCVALGKLAEHRPDLALYVPPAPADTGQSLGNALWLAYADSSPVGNMERLKGIRSAALGPEHEDDAVADAVEAFLEENREHSAIQISDQAELATEVVKRILAGEIIGLRHGRAEYGPRALGQSSIIADPRDHKMHDRVNKVKRREPFRPYAPSILAEYVNEYFEMTTESPFMSFAGRVRPGKQSLIPAVVHVDGSARYQTVSTECGLYRSILEKFHKQTGVPVLLNTSFNIAGDPMVETPGDALDAYLRSGMNTLVLGSWVIARKRERSS